MHRRRQRDLATFIELEPTPTWTVFDLPPLSQYELYIRQYGKSNTVQTATQFKDEDEIAEQAVQCEGVETAPKWVQTYGGEGREGSGGDILTSKKPAASTSDIMGFLQRSAWVRSCVA